MSVRQIKAGTTNVSVNLRIIDSTDGTPETGVVFDTAGIDLWYRREAAASVDITEADLATPALTDAHADGGFLHINDGWYRLDLPDAACAAGATGVQIGGTVTGMVVLAPYIELVAYDPYDTVRLGLTALPDAAADAAGGLPISDAGGLDMDAQRADVAATLVDTSTTLQAEVDGLQEDTEDIQARLPAALVNSRMDSTVDSTGMESTAIDAILDDTVGDGTLTVRQVLRVLVAGMAAKLSGAATTTVTIRNVADSADVIVATVDADGNRSATTVTP